MPPGADDGDYGNVSSSLSATIDGSGVTIAVLDSGIHGFEGLIRGLDGRWRQCLSGRP